MNKQKKIAILGSTGSIGTQALEIISQNEDLYQVVALTCGRRLDLLINQIEAFHPQVVCVELEQDALSLEQRYPSIEVLFGDAGLRSIAQNADWDLLLNGLVGIVGLAPTVAAIRKGKQIALANKETLVAGGELVMKKAKDAGVEFLPVDSEHSAIFQAMQGNRHNLIHSIYLTASGGPFRGYTLDQLKAVTLEQALRHPNWSMGQKITIDSATMMNKGLEVIEAKWLFHMPVDSIRVLVHKESIIHSMVEFVDHSILAQMGAPDMKGPISYAFTYPDRFETTVPSVDFVQLGALHFEEVDQEVFRCLSLAYEVARLGESYPVVLNAANEELVRQFLARKRSFLEIQTRLDQILESHVPVRLTDVDEILELDQEIKERIRIWG